MMKLFLLALVSILAVARGMSIEEFKQLDSHMRELHARSKARVGLRGGSVKEMRRNLEMVKDELEEHVFSSARFVSRDEEPCVI